MTDILIFFLLKSYCFAVRFEIGCEKIHQVLKPDASNRAHSKLYGTLPASGTRSSRIRIQLGTFQNRIQLRKFPVSVTLL